MPATPSQSAFLLVECFVQLILIKRVFDAVISETKPATQFNLDRTDFNFESLAGPTFQRLWALIDGLIRPLNECRIDKRFIKIIQPFNLYAI